MIFCEFKIKEFYAKQIEEGKISDSRIKEIIDFIQNLHDLGYSQKQVVEMAKSLADENMIDNFYELSRLSLQMQKNQSILNRMQHPMYENLTNVVEDMFFPSSVRQMPGSGINVQNLKHFYYEKLAMNFDRILSADDGGLLFQEMGNFTIDEWEQVLTKMSDPSHQVDEALERIADIFDHQNHVLFAEKSKSGAKDIYNPNYLYKRMYDFDSFKQAGLKQVVLDFIQSINYNKLQSEFTGDMINKLKLKRTLEFLNDSTLTDDELRNILKNPSENHMANLSIDLLQAMGRFFDSVTNVHPDTLDLSDISQYRKGFALFKEREIEFDSIRGGLNIMEKYGKFGSNIYKYIKEDSIKSSKALAFMDIFGPKVNEGWQVTKNTALQLSKITNKPFSEGSAENMFSYMKGDYQRIPDNLILNPFNPEAYSFANVSVAERRLSQISASAYLFGSGLTNLFLDPGNVIANQLLKSNESFIPRIMNFTQQYIESLAPAFKDNPQIFFDVIDIAEKTFGEEMLRENLKESIPGKMADTVVTLGGGRLANKISSILSFKVLNHMVKNNLVKDVDVYLLRYGLNRKDLDFVLENEIFQMVDSINMLALQNADGKYLIPDVILESNPRGIKPSQYREIIAKGFSMYLDENRRIFSPHLGDKQGYYLVFGDSQNHPVSILSRALTQFARIPLKTAEDLRLHMEMKSISQNMQAGEATYSTKELTKKRLLNGAVGVATVAASMGLVGFGYKLFRKIAQDADAEKTYNDLFNRAKNNNLTLWQKMMVESTIQYSPGGIIWEKLMHGRMSFDTPVISVAKAPVVAAQVGINFVTGREPIKYNEARDLVDSAAGVIPFQSTIYLTPFAQEYINQQRKMIRYIERLDGQ